MGLSVDNIVFLAIYIRYSGIPPFTRAVRTEQIIILSDLHKAQRHNSGIGPKIGYHILPIVFVCSPIHLSISVYNKIVVIIKATVVAPFTATVFSEQIIIVFNFIESRGHNACVRPKIRHHILAVILITNPAYLQLAVGNKICFVLIHKTTIVAPLAAAILAEEITFSIDQFYTLCHGRSIGIKV